MCIRDSLHTIRDRDLNGKDRTGKTELPVLGGVYRLGADLRARNGPIQRERRAETCTGQNRARLRVASRRLFRLAPQRKRTGRARQGQVRMLASDVAAQAVRIRQIGNVLFPQRDNRHPVSYTHLDVYKRQHQR